MSLHLPIAILVALSFTSGDRVVGLYGGPLIGINHVRVAYSSPNEVRSLIRLDLSDVIAKGTVTKSEKLNASIADDLRIVRERVVNEDLTVAPEPAESRVRDWSETVRPLAYDASDVIFGRREKQDCCCRIRRPCGSCCYLWFWRPLGGGGFGCSYARQNVRSRDLHSAGRADPCIFLGYSMSKLSSPQCRSRKEVSQIR